MTTSRDNHKVSHLEAAARAFKWYAVSLAMTMLIIFLPAGTVRWWNGWLYTASLFIPMLFALFYMALKDPELLMQHLGDLGFGITRVNGSGRFTQTVAILLLVIPRREETRLLSVLQQDYPDLLFTIEDISTMSERGGYFGNRRKHFLSSFLGQ